MKDTMVHLFENHCECGLFSIKFHLLDHLCDDLEKFHTIKVFHDAPYEHINVVLRREYRGTYIMKATRIREEASVLKPIVDRR